jgi:hypothetical protein
MKASLVSLAILSLAAVVILLLRLRPTRASSPLSNSVTESIQTESCTDRYDSLLHNAGAALAAGDRAGSVNFLEQAKRLIPICPPLQDGASRALITALRSSKSCGVHCLQQSES